MAYSSGMSNEQDPSPFLSVIIPAYNEEESVGELIREVREACDRLGESYEIVVVNDGSTDRTLERLTEIGGVTVVTFTRNFGKSQALLAGFKAARGSYLVTLDADLQDDPQEIPRFVEALQGGADLVCGWKKTRHDPASKRIASKIANAVTRAATGVAVHDMNCGFKGYARAVILELDLQSDFHRYIPALAAQKGFRIEELAVNHRARKYGHSKYRMGRILNGGLDFVSIVLLGKFMDRPMHLFGSIGLALCAIGGAALVYLTVLKLAFGESIGERPLLMLGVLLVVVGCQSFSLGFVSDLFLRTGGRRHVYVVRETALVPKR
jgi:glycosyltransferase involved in cell wall biosynthesis